MNFEFVFQYPAWFIIACLALGLVYAWLLYRKSTDFKENPVWLIRVLFLSRFTVVSIIAFLLLSPLLKFITREVEKPIVVILQDNTESLISGKDSGYYRSKWPEVLEQLTKKLEDKYDVKSYLFDDQLTDSFKLDYSGKETDIANALKEVNNLYLNRNVGAVIIGTDGIYNKGSNPLYVVNELKAPVYTIGLGDTTIKRDLVIAKLNHNQLGYLNNTFPVEVIIDARKLKGKTSQIQLEKEGKVLATESIQIESESFLKTVEFRLKADQVGVQKYRAIVKPVEGEYTPANNYRDFFIEVIDSRQKVLILADAPHPDVAALKFTLQKNENYEVESALAENFKGSVKQYSLVILHQLPGKAATSGKLMADLEAGNVPTLFILGLGTSPGALNAVQNMIQFSGSRGSMNEAQARINTDFGLFILSDELTKALQRFEPLQVPNSTYKVLPTASVLLYQRIGTVDTDYPLLVFSVQGDRKSGMLVGEGIWRWKLQSYAENQKTDQFDELFSKIVQYLSVRSERKNFRIITKNSFFENESISMEAEVYNESFELITKPDVQITIIDSKNRNYPFTFSKTATSYRLNAGILKDGNYRYEASVNINGKVFKAVGSFVVKPVVAEIMNTRADHTLLQTLSLKNGAEMILPADIMSLPEKLLKREDLKPISRSETRLKELIHLNWLFFLILGLLGLEWFLRKRNGAY
jgi:hypothetical protein